MSGLKLNLLDVAFINKALLQVAGNLLLDTNKQIFICFKQSTS